MNQTRGTRHSIRPHHSPESQPEAAPAPVPGREVATTNLTPNLLVLLDSLELLKWSPRSDSSRRPSDYGSDAHSLAASANTRLALSLSTRRDPITGDSNSASRSLRSGVLVGNSSTEVMARHPVLWTSGSRSTASGSLLSSGAVSAPDQRGYSPGARPTTIQAYRMPELVADVVAIADRLDVETFDLVGPDWGGVVAWQLAGRHPDRVATLTAVSTPASAGLFARALVAGTQALRSAYIPMLRLPRLPELLLGGHRQWGLRRLLAQDGLGADWVDTAIWAWPNRARCRRRWPGTGRPRRSACGSRSLLVPATGCPSSTPWSWAVGCWSTWGVGAPGKAREGRPADANAIELGAGLPADAAGRLSEWPGSGTLDRALQLAGLCSAVRRRPPPRQLRDRQRLLIIKTAVGRHATASTNRS